MRQRAALLLVLLFALPGCLAQGPGGRDRGGDPLRPPGVAAGRAAVDPVVVGDRLMAAGEPELALDAYLRAAAGPGGATPAIRQSVARADVALGRLRQARTLLREVVAAEPRNASARNDLGVVLYELGETGEAHRMFQSAFALQPRPEIRDNLRLSGARLADTVGDVDRDAAFSLTRRDDGIVVLHSPDARP